MTTKAEWLALSERCEKATGPDREIEKGIHRALGLAPEQMYQNGYGWVEDTMGWRLLTDGDIREHPKRNVPLNVTASLDAITALIERELPGFYWSAITRATPLGEHTAEGVITNGKLFMTGERRGWDVFAYVPTLALCAAFCRAMAEKALTE